MTSNSLRLAFIVFGELVGRTNSIIWGGRRSSLEAAACGQRVCLWKCGGLEERLAAAGSVVIFGFDSVLDSYEEQEF